MEMHRKEDDKTAIGYRPLEDLMEQHKTGDIVYGEMVNKLVKDGQVIMDQMTREKADLLHMALGVAGEAGELVDAIKKFAIYNKPIDKKNVREELGDLEFFMERIRQRLGISRAETLDNNVEKLGKRYKDLTYSDKQAHDRADKK